MLQSDNNSRRNESDNNSVVAFALRSAEQRRENAVAAASDRDRPGAQRGGRAAGDDSSLRVARQRERLLHRLLEFFAGKATRREYLDAVVEVLAEWTGCRCVGVRVVDDEGGMPYESYVGFSKEFWEKEDHLSARTDVCICTRVVNGVCAGHERALLTEGGSFSCGDAPAFLEALPADRLPMYRGKCVDEGFRSLAAVAIRRGGWAVGLIHLADERPDLVPPDKIEFVETMALLIGEAIYRFTMEDRLRSVNASLEQRARQLRRLASELAQAEDRERSRLAQTLHDNLQQVLVAARYRVNGICGANDADSCLPNSAAAEMKKVDELLGVAIDMSRSLAVELSPPVLRDGGLGAGLRWLARWMTESHGLAVELSLADGAEPKDEDICRVLFQSVRELVLNVAKHAGVKSVAVILRSRDDGWHEVIVRDEGAGFDAANAAGSGLGLFRIRERIGLLGGRVEVDSAPGRGTRIVLLAPGGMPAFAAPAKSDSMGEEGGDGKPGGGSEKKMRVLVVDDHAVLRRGLIELLQKESFIDVVGQAGDGLQAIDEARRLRPDAIVMDISMPRMNGIEATRIICAEMPSVRVVGLSMHDRSDMARAMRDVGAVAYVAKDSPVEEIIAGIRGS
jgi:signal transduction histidine kinase